MLLGIYFVGLSSSHKGCPTDAPCPPSVPYDYNLASLALKQPSVGSAVAYGLQTPQVTCDGSNFLQDRFCALAKAYGPPGIEITPPQITFSKTALKGVDTRTLVTIGPELSSMYFAPLPGTAAEAHSIQSLFRDAKILTGRDASKTSLKQVAGPSILHIATHGFYLDESAAPGGARGPIQARKLDNPLVRSGLALAGANLNKRGDNGVLTALEASGLNLWGTEVVTLSGCETGLGEVKKGEGVYGLRRAFLLAGAQSLVMSLWPVSDRVTQETMTAYYTGLKAGLGRGEALRQAQLSMLRRKQREHPFFWAGFIHSGDWRSLDGR